MLKLVIWYNANHSWWKTFWYQGSVETCGKAFTVVLP